MSRSGNKSKILSNLPNLMHSVLFRRLLVSWTVILAVLLVLVVVSLIIVVNSIFLSHEARYLNSCIDVVNDVRLLGEEGAVDSADLPAIQDKLIAAQKCSVYIFDEELELTESFVHYNRVEPPPVAAFAEYAEKVYASGDLEAEKDRLGGVTVIVAGTVVKYSSKPSECIVCFRSVENVQRKQAVLLLCVISAITVALLLGVFVLIRHISYYVTPFTEIAQAAIDMSYGNLNTRVKHENEQGELGLLSRSFNRLSASLSQNFIQLEQERSRLVQIVNSSSHGIAVTDESGELIQYNPALLELFSQMRLKAKHDITDDRRLMVIPDKAIWEKFDSVNASGTSERMVYPIDAEHVLWINFSPVISAEGEQVGVVGNFQDMTELERLERTRREYVANVSHELRRPLTALQGLLEPIRDGLVTEEEDKQRYYDIMLHEIERLSRLISDMMQLSRLQSDKIKMQMEPLDISEIVMDVAESYRSDIEGRGTTLSVDTAENMVAVVDADRVEQVIIILVDNAIKFTPDDGSISIRTYRSGDRVCMEVSDTGCGISEEDLPHVFERFYKADKSHASEGTGLGLSIANNIIEKMHGSITCESELGKGTAMRVSFDAYVPEEEGEAQ